MTLDDIVLCKEFVQQLGFIVHKGGGVFVDNTINWTHEIAELNTSYNYATIYNAKISTDGKPFFSCNGDRIYDPSEFRSRLIENIKKYKQYLSLYRLNHIDKDFI